MSPKNQERKFEPAYAKTLLKIAKEDYSTGRFAQAGVETGEVRPENTFFCTSKRSKSY